jgi:hypothetical protein
VRISGSNAGYTMFRGGVKSTGYPLHSPVSPFTSPPVRHRVPSRFNCTVQIVRYFLPPLSLQNAEVVKVKYSLVSQNGSPDVHHNSVRNINQDHEGKSLYRIEITKQNDSYEARTKKGKNQ